MCIASASFMEIGRWSHLTEERDLSSVRNFHNCWPIWVKFDMYIIWVRKFEIH